MVFFEKLKEIASGFMSMSLGVRILIGTLLGAFGSSTLIGFLAELGAVNYALAYGARLPTEGVPYLRYATTVICLAMFAIAFGVFFVLNITIRSGIIHFLAIPPMRKLTESGDITAIPLGKYILMGAFPALAGTQGLVMLLYLTAPVNDLPQWILPVFTFLAAILILLLARKPGMAKWLILSVFTIAIGIFLFIAFTPLLYGKALAFSRQGGDVVVHLHMACDDPPKCEPVVTGALFLRTTEAFLLRDKLTQEFREIPARRVESVRYTGEERWGTK